jgi:hypothetical protein
LVLEVGGGFGDGPAVEGRAGAEVGVKVAETVASEGAEGFFGGWLGGSLLASPEDEEYCEADDNGAKDDARYEASGE